MATRTRHRTASQRGGDASGLGATFGELFRKLRSRSGMAGQAERSAGPAGTMTTTTRTARAGLVGHEKHTRARYRTPEKVSGTTRWGDREGQGDPKAMTVQAKANEPEASPVQLPRAAADASRSQGRHQVSIWWPRQAHLARRGPLREEREHGPRRLVYELRVATLPRGQPQGSSATPRTSPGQAQGQMDDVTAHPRRGNPTQPSVIRTERELWSRATPRWWSPRRNP